MADKMMRIAGRDNEGLAKGIRVNQYGEIITMTPSRQYFFLEEEAVRDVNTRDSEPIYLREYINCTFIVNNTLDSDVRLRPKTSRSFINYYESGEFINTGREGAIIVPKNSLNVVINEVRPRIFNHNYLNLVFNYNAVTTPTKGALSIILIANKIT